MASKARLESDGALYHVLKRGDRQEIIFRDDADRRRFLETLDEVCERTGWRLHAYGLMSNHYHLMLETPQANLVAGMRWFQTTYTLPLEQLSGLRHRQRTAVMVGGRESVVGELGLQSAIKEDFSWLPSTAQIGRVEAIPENM